MITILTLAAAFAQTPDAPIQTETEAPAVEEEVINDDRFLRLEILPAILPMGAEFRANIGLTDQITVYVGGGAGMAVLGTNSPTRLRASGGVRYYFDERLEGFNMGLEGSGAQWSAAPSAGGTNVAAGPMVGWAQPFPHGQATLISQVGAMAHFYTGDYANPIGDGTTGDGKQVLPHLEISLVL